MRQEYILFSFFFFAARRVYHDCKTFSTKKKKKKEKIKKCCPFQLKSRPDRIDDQTESFRAICLSF